MKILKPGKVEQRTFVCPECGCVFMAEKCEAVKLVGQDGNTTISLPYYVECPCSEVISWDDGEPYEESTQDDRERLASLIRETPDVTVRPDALAEITEHLIANGVTFREGD